MQRLDAAALECERVERRFSEGEQRADPLLGQPAQVTLDGHARARRSRPRAARDHPVDHPIEPLHPAPSPSHQPTAAHRGATSPLPAAAPVRTGRSRYDRDMPTETERQPLTLLLVHAHPDDEVFSTGGLLARADDEGIRTVLVTSTGGENGEIHDPDLDPDEAKPRLAEIREGELRRAAEILGIDEVRMLGYRDSGMRGTPENDDSRAFLNADRDEAIGRVVRILREVRPDVVATYDPGAATVTPTTSPLTRWQPPRLPPPPIRTTIPMPALPGQPRSSTGSPMCVRSSRISQS